MLKQRCRRTINFDEKMTDDETQPVNTYKSDSNLFKPTINQSLMPSNSTNCTPKKLSNKNKDRERRKSLLQSLTEFFQKRKESNSSPCPNGSSSTRSSKSGATKGKFSMFRSSPKIKNKSQVRLLISILKLIGSIKNVCPLIRRSE